MIKIIYILNLTSICTILLCGCTKKLQSVSTIDVRWGGKYITPANELEDDMLILKQNGNFVFYRKNVLVPFVRADKYKGTYQIKNDTLHFNWSQVKPQSVRKWLGHTGLVGGDGNSIILFDDLSQISTKTMHRKK